MAHRNRPRTENRALAKADPAAYGWCNRCSCHWPVAELAELTLSCGCVDRYCIECRTRKAEHLADGYYKSLPDWMESWAVEHRKNGGRYGGQFSCPSRWDDPSAVADVLTRRPL